MMKDSFKKGFSFGLTEGIITTIGLMVGLTYGTHSKLAVLGGILTIAIADAASDGLGIHISEEWEDKHSAKDVWESTFSTVFTKFFFTMTFVVPVLLFDLSTAIMLSVIYGLFILGIFSFLMAKGQKQKAWKVVGEHLLIAILVIITTYYVGNWISVTFG